MANAINILKKSSLALTAFCSACVTPHYSFKNNPEYRVVDGKTIVESNFDQSTPLMSPPSDYASLWIDNFILNKPFDGTWPTATQAIKSVSDPVTGGDLDEELVFLMVVATYDDKKKYDDIHSVLNAPLRLDTTRFPNEHNWFLPRITPEQVLSKGAKDVQYWMGYGDKIELGKPISLDEFEIKGETKRTAESTMLFDSLETGACFYTQILVFEETGYTSLKWIRDNLTKEFDWKTATLPLKLVVEEFDIDDPDASIEKLTAIPGTIKDVISPDLKTGLQYAAYIGIEDGYLKNLPEDSQIWQHIGQPTEDRNEYKIPVGLEYAYVSSGCDEGIANMHSRNWKGNDQFKINFEFRDALYNKAASR